MVEKNLSIKKYLLTNFTDEKKNVSKIESTYGF